MARHSLWSLASFRMRVAVALALAFSIEGLMRSNINMAMVCMVNETALERLAASNAAVSKLSMTTPISLVDTPTPDTFTTELGELMQLGVEDSSLICVNKSIAKKTRKADGELIITKSEQGMIFTAFYAGGLAIIMPGSYLCDRFGATNVVFYGAIVNVIGSLATPFVARVFGATALTLLRFVMGCGQGVLVPCMNVLITYWFPMAEKVTAIAIATTGNQISVIVALFLTAEFCQWSWLGGWAAAFYSYGIVGVIFCVLWMMWVADTPAQAKHIKPAEIKFINADERRRNDPVPWRTILTSLVVWSTSLSSFSQYFMTVGVTVYLPSYYRNVFGMDISSNGSMSSLPFVVQLLTKILFVAVADWLKERGIMSNSSVVKLFNLIASLGSGICFIFLAFCDCTQSTLAITLAITAVGLSSGFIPGYNASVVLIAPRYASPVASFSRLLSQIASVMAPYMIGVIVVKGVREEWQLAFFIMAFILISTGILFQCCGSASVQEWAKMPRAPPAYSANALLRSDANDEIGNGGLMFKSACASPVDIIKIVAAADNVHALLKNELKVNGFGKGDPLASDKNAPITGCVATATA